MASRSVTPRPEQELAIALAPEDRRGQEAVYFPVERSDYVGDLRTDARMDRRIPHDPFLCIARPGLELRLDERHELGRGARQPHCDGKYQPERDEAHIHDDKIRRLGQAARIEAADVGLFERDHLGPLPQPGIELIAADIDRIDEPCPARE